MAFLFASPVSSGSLGYGYVPGRHIAQDYEVSKGTPVMAARAGKVISIGDAGALGNTVKIQHDGGYQTFYGNLGKYDVTPGSSVVTGQVIGTSDGAVGDPNPGDSTGPHLPFQVWHNGAAVNPTTVTAPPNGAKPTLADAIGDGFNAINPLNALAPAFKEVTSVGFWVRAAFFITGSTILIIVIITLVARTDAGQKAIQTGKDTAKEAAEVAFLAPK